MWHVNKSSITLIMDYAEKGFTPLSIAILLGMNKEDRLAFLAAIETEDSPEREAYLLGRAQGHESAIVTLNNIASNPSADDVDKIAALKEAGTQQSISKSEDLKNELFGL